MWLVLLAGTVLALASVGLVLANGPDHANYVDERWGDASIEDDWGLDHFQQEAQVSKDNPT